MRIWVELDNEDRRSCAEFIKEELDNAGNTLENATTWLNVYLEEFEDEFYMAAHDALRREYK